VMAVVQDRQGSCGLAPKTGWIATTATRCSTQFVSAAWQQSAQQLDCRAGQRGIRQAVDRDRRRRSRLARPDDRPLRPAAPRGGQPSVSSEEKVRALHLDHTGHLWIATRTAGLVELDVASGRVRRFKHTDADSATLSDDGIFAITEGRNGALWLGTQRGLDRLDPVSGGLKDSGRVLSGA